MRRSDSYQSLVRLGISLLGTKSAAHLYCATGIDVTYPTAVYAKITNACNSRCAMCDVWRHHDKREIPAHFWIDALWGLHSYTRKVKVSFSGGEVLLRKDIFEIFEACADSKIPFGMVTNGLLLTRENVKRFLACQPMNLSISLDSLNDVTYRAIRGASFLQQVLENIEFLMDYLRRIDSHLMVTLKTVVNRRNLSELTALAAYAQHMGVSGITFDPIKRRREPFISETISEFEDLFSMDLDSLSEVIGELTRMKRAGYPITNSEENMLDWLHYADHHVSETCMVPLTSLYIDPLGNIRLCDFDDVNVGNIQQQDLSSVWHQEPTRSRRRELVRCKKACVYCVRRSLRDYIHLFFAYTKQ